MGFLPDFCYERLLVFCLLPDIHLQVTNTTFPDLAANKIQTPEQPVMVLLVLLNVNLSGLPL